MVAAAQDPPEPVVSIWYRGTPAGTPKFDDLVAIAAAGFKSVTWPASQIAGVPELQRLARDAGLAVDVVATPRPLTLTSGVPSQRVDVITSGVVASVVPALVWRAVARGARFVAFDGGTATGPGLTDTKGGTPGWVWPALSVSRVFTGNDELLSLLRPATVKPSVLSGGTRWLDVALFDTPRAWVAIATNLGAGPVRAMVRLPKGVPYASWVNLMDGEAVAMFDEPAGPRWDMRLKPGEARVIVIDRPSTWAMGDRAIGRW
ncbi:MAG TPA: hypothetical protein VFV98_09750, partial [Vicinamibacterales bacterium]|nr:hypothetical protein [Vicinamibacterales bacterium]